MRLTNDEPNPWLLEDVGLRCAAAAETMEEALKVFDSRFTDAGDEASIELQAQRSEAEAFVIRATAYACHLRATNLAYLLRKPTGRRGALEAELRAVLKHDRANQLRELARRSKIRIPVARPLPLQVAERWIVPDRVDTAAIDSAIALLDEDLDIFLRTHLLPSADTANAGQFSLTSR
jgi:hypothetical protein